MVRQFATFPFKFFCANKTGGGFFIKERMISMKSKFSKLIPAVVGILFSVCCGAKAQTQDQSASATQTATATVTATVVAQPTASAGVMTLEEGQQFLSKLRCVTCHDINQDKVGPAYKKVAARYSNPDEATKAYLKGMTPEEYLFKKVRSGTVLFGVNKNKNWLKNDKGADFALMTPNGPDVISDADLKKMLQFVLSLK